MNSPDQAPENTRGAYTWPAIVIGLLVLHATIIMLMVRFAVSDPDFVIVRDQPPATVETTTAGDPGAR